MAFVGCYSVALIAGWVNKVKKGWVNDPEKLTLQMGQ